MINWKFRLLHSHSIHSLLFQWWDQISVLLRLLSRFLDAIGITVTPLLTLYPTPLLSFQTSTPLLSAFYFSNHGFISREKLKHILQSDLNKRKRSTIFPSDLPISIDTFLEKVCSGSDLWYSISVIQFRASGYNFDSVSTFGCISFNSRILSCRPLSSFNSRIVL